MRYVDHEEVPHEEVEKVFDAMTAVFEASDADVGTAMGEMCHKLAAMAAEFTSTEEEAGILIAAFANDALVRVDLYRKQRLDS